MASLHLEELKEIITRIFQKPRLRVVLETMSPNEDVPGLILLDEEKRDLISAFKFSKSNASAYLEIVESVKDNFLHLHLQEHDRLMNDLLFDDSLSLKAKILNNQSKDFKPFIRAYQVAGKPINAAKPKNILCLSPSPKCYVYNEGIKQLQDEMYQRGMFGGIIISTTTMDARPLLETRQIDGVFNCDWGRHVIRSSKEEILSALNVNPLNGKRFNDQAFNNYVMSLPMNYHHGDIYDFFIELKKGKRLEQGELQLK